MITHHVLVTALLGVPYDVLRQWARRDHITAYPRGRFDLVEVRARLLARDTRGGQPTHRGRVGATVAS